MSSRDTGRLIIVCGLPGSGKTRLAVALQHELAGVRMSPDDWMEALAVNLHDEAVRSRIEALQWTLTQRLLELGCVVIIEWGTWARSERDALRTTARELGVAVELRYVSAPPDVLVERVRARAMENPPITEEAIRGWFIRFEEPGPDEMALYDPPEALGVSRSQPERRGR